MKRTFKVQKLELHKLISLLVDLYERGIDYVDLSSDNSVPGQDKLIVHTKDEYINPDYKEEFGRKELPPHEENNDIDFNELI